MECCSNNRDWKLRLGKWQDVLTDIDKVEAVITDPPYSSRTHSGHNVGSVSAGNRAEVNYDSWDQSNVDEFCDYWMPRCNGWFVVITDHVLCPFWENAFNRNGFYSFAPLAYVAPGSRVRLIGDGPSCWSCWIMVARPKTKEFSTWGSLPGAYILPKGYAENRSSHWIAGAKPTWLMKSIVRDYTKRNNLIIDPFAGTGTTLLSAVMEGRRVIGAECNKQTYEIAKKRLLGGFTLSFDWS